jgi:hypothetical protein
MFKARPISRSDGLRNACRAINSISPDRISHAAPHLWARCQPDFGWRAWACPLFGACVEVLSSCTKVAGLLAKSLLP